VLPNTGVRHDSHAVCCPCLSLDAPMCAGAPAASPFDEGHTSVLSFGPSAARRGRPLTVLCTLVDAVTQPRERERDREKRSTVSLVTTRLVHHGRWTGHPRPGAPAASRTTWPASRTTWRGASSGAPPSICGFSGSSAGGGGCRASPFHVPREDGPAHPDATSRTNLAAASGLLSTWRLSKP
jgi:hypothetical protein